MAWTPNYLNLFAPARVELTLLSPTLSPNRLAVTGRLESWLACTSASVSKKRHCLCASPGVCYPWKSRERSTAGREQLSCGARRNQRVRPVQPCTTSSIDQSWAFKHLPSIFFVTLQLSPYCSLLACLLAALWSGKHETGNGQRAAGHLTAFRSIMGRPWLLSHSMQSRLC